MPFGSSRKNRSEAEVTASARRVHRIADLLDSAFKLPGTNYQLGWDGIIGLIPGTDFITAVPGLIIVYEAYRIGMKKTILARMVGNLLLDTLLGSVPLVGDLFDFVFKANRLNAELYKKGLEKMGYTSTNDGTILKDVIDV